MRADALETEPDAEKLDKLRVSLRQLRTLLWAYRPLLDSEFDSQQRAVNKFLANAAGSTRDWDILIGLVEKKCRGGAAKCPFTKTHRGSQEEQRNTVARKHQQPVARCAKPSTQYGCAEDGAQKVRSNAAVLRARCAAKAHETSFASADLGLRILPRSSEDWQESALPARVF